MKLFILSLAFLLFFAACNRQTANQPQFTAENLTQTNWENVEAKSRGTIVNFAMWSGDEARNRFTNNFAARQIKEKYDITLNVVPLGDTAEVVNKLLNEKNAGRNSGGSVDLIWINGENFRRAKEAKLLWGGFADRLPNLKFYEPDAAKRDFGTEIENLEAPWQKAQFVLAYDTARTNAPPKSVRALGEWIKANPNKFAYIAPPDFTGSAFLRHVLFEFGGGAQNFQEFDEQIYQNAAAQTFDFLNEIKPYLWRKGENYPATTKELDRLFANGEVDLAYGYGAGFASERIKRGEFPATVKTFVLDAGTISNYNFLTVPFNAENPAGALVVVNYLLSPEYHLAQSRELGSIYPHQLDKLSDAERRAVNDLPRGAATLTAEELAAHAVAEADSEYLERLEKDWRERVLLK